MRIKRYVVSSMQEAMKKIQQDLGKDAVILNTKQIKPQGLLGFMSKKKIEIVAATDVVKNDMFSQNDSSTTPHVRSDSVHNALANETYAGVKTPDESTLQIYREIKQMKELIHQLNVQGGSANSVVMNKLKRYLQAQDFDDEWIIKLMESKPGEEERQAIRIVEHKLRSFLQDCPICKLSENTTIAYFVGPTGVGKTTTIAKLAAEQVLNCGRKVGFITADTYRISAVEQLRTYAELLNVPIRVVHSPADVSDAVKDLKNDCDLLFMDTAGRNFNNLMYVSEVNRLFESEKNSEIYLVLSLTSKYVDMKKIVENFSQFHLDRVLFTKMDETQSFGSIFNLLSEFPLKPSYIATGQSVPDDIIAFDPDFVVSRLLEGWSNE